MNGENDQVLAERLLKGDQAAFRELVETYKKRIYGLALGITRNHADAEDVSQEVFMKVYRSIKTFQRDAKLGSWLYRIAVNTAIDQRRKKTFFPAQFSEAAGAVIGDEFQGPAATSAGPEQTADAGLLRIKIDKALDKVSEREKAVFLLRHDHDLNLSEIAEVLQISVGSVKSYLFRVIKKIQKELQSSRLLMRWEIDHE